MREMRSTCRILLGKPEKGSLQDLGLNGRIILKLIFEKLL
jgi:hypothetical protein